MSEPVLLDTDVLVDYLRGQPQAVALVKEAVVECAQLLALLPAVS